MCLSWLSISMGLVQERRNSSALTMELRVSCTNPLIWAKLRCAYGIPHSITLAAWVSWHPKSPATHQFVQQLVQSNNKRNIDAPNYCTKFICEFLWQRAGNTESVPIYHDVIMPFTYKYGVTHRAYTTLQKTSHKSLTKYQNSMHTWLAFQSELICFK